MNLQPSTVYGCVLASWTDGLFVHPDVVFQGDNGGGFATIASDQYEVHSARGAIVKKPYDSTGTAVDWTGYTAGFRASYALYNPSTNSATYVTNEAQTVQEQDFGIAPFDPVTSQLNLSTAPANQYLAGDYLSLGAVGTRPYDRTHGTGIWGDATGLYGLNASTQEVVFSAATGKITAGAGAVTMDADGITLLEGAATVNYLRWATSGGTPVGIEYTDQTANLISRVSYPLRSANTDRVTYQLSANADPTTGQSPSLGLFIVAHGSTHATNASKTWLNLLTNGVQTFSGFGIGLATSLTEPSALLHLRDTAPTVRLEDATASAKSLQIKVDANLATFEEAGGTDMLVMDLANARIGIGTASPTSGYKLETSESILVNSSTNNSGFVALFTGSSSASVGPQNSFTTNDGAAVVANDRIGTFLFNGYDGTAEVLSAAIIARATETWATTTNRGSQIDFLATPNGSVTIATPMILSATTLTLANAVNIAVNTSTGTKIGTGTTQKLGFWNATPIVQPTTSYGAASFTANAGTAVNDASTFDGYTLKQVVSALRGTGLLA